MSLCYVTRGNPNEKAEKELLRLSGLDVLYPLVESVSRFRNICLETDKEEIPEGFDLCVQIMSRTGGGNREHYEDSNECLAANPTCIGDKDAWWDTTYALFYFEVLDEHKAAAQKMLQE